MRNLRCRAACAATATTVAAIIAVVILVVDVVDSVVVTDDISTVGHIHSSPIKSKQNTLHNIEFVGNYRLTR